MRQFDPLSYSIIGAALRVHSRLGPGLFESVYHHALGIELVKCGLRVESKKGVSFDYEGHRFERAFVADLVVEGSVIIEIKSVAAVTPVMEKQLQTYLRLSGCRVGLLINFNVEHLRTGIKRVVNNF